MTHNRLLGATHFGKTSEPPLLHLTWTHVGLGRLWSSDALGQSHNSAHCLFSSPSLSERFWKELQYHSNMKLSPLRVFFTSTRNLSINLDRKCLPKMLWVEGLQCGLCFCSIGSSRQICFVFWDSLQWPHHVTVCLTCHENLASEKIPNDFPWPRKSMKWEQSHGGGSGIVTTEVQIGVEVSLG